MNKEKEKVLLDLIDELIAELDVTYTDTTITTKNVKIQNPIVSKIIIHKNDMFYIFKYECKYFIVRICFSSLFFWNANEIIIIWIILKLYIDVWKNVQIPNLILTIIIVHYIKSSKNDFTLEVIKCCNHNGA